MSTNHILNLFFVLFASLFSPLLYAQEIANYDIQWGVKVPMRDGVNLAATIYKPHNQQKALPVILDLTPYISDTYHIRAKYFSQRGYVYALVDCRGRGSSEGVFDPFMQEAKDGYDLVEWFAKQSYCNEQVTMWGGSYSGYNQWATAKEFPPHLITIVPVAAAHPGMDYPMISNIFTPYVISHLTYMSGKTPNGNLFNEGSYWKTKYMELYTKHLPFKDLDKLVGNETTNFHKWLLHPTYDDYWKSMNPTSDDFKKLTIPILTITGHYDGDQLGNLIHYKNFMQHASAEARAGIYLVIGPWDHAGTRTPQQEIGGVRFGAASILDLNNLHKQWYDFTMKAGSKPDFLKKQVAYYVMGSEKWKYADNLESIASEKLKYFLCSDGSVNDIFHSGQLSTIFSEKSKQDEIKYNPLSPQTGVNSGLLQSDATYLKTNLVRTIDSPPLDVMSVGSEIAVYHTDPLSDTTEVSGFIKLKIYLSSNVPDADLSATLYEITPSGESIYLTADVLRLRYRESLEYEKLMKLNEVYECYFKRFNFFSKQVPKGSRLRLVIAAINSVSWQKNFCSGGVVALESAQDAGSATILIHHEKKYPSILEIPVVK